MDRELKRLLANALAKECGIHLFDEEGYVIEEHPLWDIIYSQRLAEREECAKVADSHDKNCGACGCDGYQIAQSIRERGK